MSGEAAEEWPDAAMRKVIRYTCNKNNTRYDGVFWVVSFGGDYATFSALPANRKVDAVVVMFGKKWRAVSPTGQTWEVKP